jgi:hypothetical protein
MQAVHGDWLVAFVTFLLFVATVASIFVAWRLGRRQETLQAELARVTGEQNAKIEKSEQARHSNEIEFQGQMSQQQRLFQQRSHLIPMWQYISSLSEIDPNKKLVTPDIVAAVNTLEFIAICCEAEVVDKVVVMRTFREKYIDLYRRIERCGELPGFSPPKTGNDLLNDNRAAKGLYQALEAERIAAGAPQTLQGGKGP